METTSVILLVWVYLDFVIAKVVKLTVKTDENEEICILK